MGRPKKYLTEEERIAAKREATRRWKAAHPDYMSEYLAKYYQGNKEKIAEYHADYYQNNKEKLAAQQAEYQAEYYTTPKGRAGSLLRKYRSNDKKYNRGECTLTAEWIVQNIFSKPCHYCSKTDWTKMGCDRIDNSLPHRPDNVVPCCCECNKKKARYSYDEFMKKIGKIA